MKWINTHMLACLIVGFYSGLPLALTGSTLQAWYTQAGVSVVGLGLLSMVGLPYVYKFLWSPLLDYSNPFKRFYRQKRKAWILLTQALLVVSLLLLAFLSPTNTPIFMAMVAVMVATFSATQDIAIDAYRTELLTPEERGMGSASCVFSYRLGMLVSGGLGLIAADNTGWRTTYILMACLMVLGLLFTVFLPKVEEVPADYEKGWDAFWLPIKTFFQNYPGWILIVFILFYKLGDAFSLALTTPFLIRELNFSLSEVGMLYKMAGFLSTITGAYLGGWLLPKLGLYRSLLWFGLLQASSILLFALLAHVGHSYPLAAAAIITDFFFGGMGTAVFMAFLMGLCDKRFTATQFALLTAISAVGRVVVGPLAGVYVAYFSWVSFYIAGFVLAVTGVLMVKLLPKKIMS